MIKNYIKIAIRNLGKYRLISSINLLGLTVGLTCCLLISVYVLNEMSYDRTNPDAERIYRITRSFLTNEGDVNLHLSSIAPAFGPRLKTDFPEFEKMTRFLPNGTTVIKFGEKLFNEQGAYYADEEFFNFFNTPVLKGNAARALSEPRSIMLSQELATKYFGKEDPINKVLKVDAQNEYKVTGVFAAFPVNSHFHPHILMSFVSLNDSTLYGERQLNSSYSNNAFFTFVKLPRHVNAKSIEARFPAFIDKHMSSFVPSGVKISKFTELFLQKLTDIHLYSHLDDELEPGGDIKRVYIFSCIALFILLIACINYMNLSTARSVVRSKEIGIRKAIGAQRRELILQFLSESVFITSIALVTGIIFSYLAIPVVNKISGQELSMSVLWSGKFILIVLLLPVLIGVMSGIYPALFMSGFNTVKVLKGVFRIEAKGLSFRKILVVSQFVISIVLIVATIVVFRQLDYMQNSTLGYDKEHIITANYYQSLNNNYESFRNELLKDPSIVEVGRSSRIPTGRLLDDLGGVSLVAGDSARKVNNVVVKFVAADHHFIPAYGFKMAAGRNFSSDFGLDSSNFIINESAARLIGWKNPHEAIGKVIKHGGVKGEIIGIVKDFHFESMHENIVPILLNFGARSGTNFGNISIRSTNLKNGVATLESVWSRFLPEIPFQFRFMEENVARLYESEQQQGKIFTGFSFIAIFIACLGLFGLSAFSISRRVKEIGVRKVLGAGIPQIVKLLSTDFLKLVLIATIVGLPLAYFMMNKWLQDFAYRIEIPWWALVLSSLVALFIAFITVSSQAFKAAASNPVKSLRTE